ncbi:MAG: hypothetical protein ACC662_00770 [Planctomycetota bacterium]
MGGRIRTDLEGRAFFLDVPEGERTIVLAEPGWVRTSWTVTVRGGETTCATLVEDAGGEVLVRVLAEDDGLPLAGARIEVPTWAAWADVEDGVQRLDVATDHRGERLLRRFPAGTWTFEVRWGRRKGRGEVELRSGCRATLEVRLAPSREKPAREDGE